MSTESQWNGIFLASGETKPLMSRPPRVQATRKLIGIIREAKEQHPGEEAFADWLANAMEDYAATFAHPVFDASEGAGGSGPECSLCGMLWPMCGHHHISHWEPVDHTNDPQETNA